MAQCWKNQVYTPRWEGPKEGWATELLPRRPYNFAVSLLGPTSRPITAHEKERWSPRQATGRHTPLAKPEDRYARALEPYHSQRSSPHTRVTFAGGQRAVPSLPTVRSPFQLSLIYFGCVVPMARARSDPMWGVPKSEVRTVNPQDRFMTTQNFFSDTCAWKGGPPAKMIPPPASDQARGRYHVDPRGVMSPYA